MLAKLGYCLVIGAATAGSTLGTSAIEPGMHIEVGYAVGAGVFASTIVWYIASRLQRLEDRIESYHGQNQSRLEHLEGAMDKLPCKDICATISKKK